MPFLVGRFNGTARRTIERLPPEILDPDDASTLTARLAALPARWALIAAAVTVAIIGIRIAIGAFAHSRGIEELLNTVGPGDVTALRRRRDHDPHRARRHDRDVRGEGGVHGPLDRRIGRSFVSVDVYRVGPLYGFSRLSAAMALSAIAPVVARRGRADAAVPRVTPSIPSITSHRREPGAAICRECWRPFVVLDARRRFLCNDRGRFRNALSSPLSLSDGTRGRRALSTSSIGVLPMATGRVPTSQP